MVAGALADENISVLISAELEIRAGASIMLEWVL
jgi:hypothetical protein